MMCDGVSLASWMMNSPRSVSTTSTPSASSTSLRWISSLAIDLPLATVRACCARTRSRTMAVASAASAAQWT